MSEYIPWNSKPLEEWRAKHAKGKFIKLNGHSTHYVEHGEGEPIILIHGFNMDLNTWIYNIDTLAGYHKVYAIDLWGQGYSTRADLDHGYDLYVEQLLAFMDALDIPRAALVGHSMGGGTAVKFALLYPERVDQLVLVDATGIPNPLPLRSRLFVLPGIAEYLMSRNSDYIRRKNLSDIWCYDKASLTDKAFSDFTQSQKIKGSTGVLLEILRKGFFHTLEEEILRLGELDIPILIIWGRYDASIPVEIGHKMHQLLEGSRYEIIDNCGHMPNFDEPDQFNRLVLDFLEEHQGSV